MFALQGFRQSSLVRPSPFIGVKPKTSARVLVEVGAGVDQTGTTRLRAREW